MFFWKRMYSSYEIRFSRKQWIFSKLFLSILSLLFSSIMRLMWSFSRWTRVLKIEKKSWWFCVIKKDIRCAMKTKFDQTSRKNTTSSRKNVARFLKFWKKIRFYFYDIKFILKINARVLVDQLNRFDTYLSDAFVIRWLV